MSPEYPNIARNLEFTEAVESFVNAVPHTCATCGKPVHIVNSLIKCDGPCGYGASIHMAMHVPQNDPATDAAARAIGRNMAELQFKTFLATVQSTEETPQ